MLQHHLPLAGGVLVWYASAAHAHVAERCQPR